MPGAHVKNAVERAAAEDFKGTERFEIRGRLGAGGMGVVYHAYDRVRRTDVALKTLLQMDADGVRRLKREFRSIADVVHPNLVALHELVFAEGRWFFTMELIRGVSFTDHIRGEALAGPHRAAASGEQPTQGAYTTTLDPTTDMWGAGCPQDEPPAARVRLPARPHSADLGRLGPALNQLVRAISALHDAGKLHLDLKPSNVLVDGSGRVVVLDFGLVRDTGADAGPESRNAAGESIIAGTPVYMAPEQMQGAVSAAADWYAVGMILYEALTGSAPFHGSPHFVIQSKAHVDPPPPISVAPGVPPALSELSMQLLQRDPSARATGADVLRILRDARAAGSSGAPPRGAAPSPRAVSGSRPEATFVGRSEHLRALEEAFGDMRRGRSVAVFVHGRSGMGKTALAQHFLNGSRGAALVLAGRCYERESVPFKAFDSVVDALTAHLRRLPRAEVASMLPPGIHDLARVFPALDMIEAVSDVPRRALEIPGPRELRTRAFQALKALLAGLAERAPLVIYMDDIQWGDRDSALLLADLLAPPDPPRLLLLGTYRSEDEASNPFLVELFRATAHAGALASEMRKVSLDPLSNDESEALARSLLGGGDDVAHEASEIAREAGGSPFFLRELALHLRRTRAASAEREDAGTGVTRGSLDALLRARLHELSADARHLLEVIAVAGQPVAQGVALRAAALEFDVQAALTALRSAGLVRTGGAEEADPVESYHDRVREIVVRHLEPARLSACHRALARELEATGSPDPERLATHCLGAGEREKASAYAAQAAEKAANALAFDHAARLFRMALELSPERRSQDLLVKLGNALTNAGRGAEAAEAYLAAAEGVPLDAALDLQRLAAEQFLISGRLDDGIRMLQAVFAALDLPYPRTPRRALAALLWRRAKLALRGRGYRVSAAGAVDPRVLRRIDACSSAFFGLFAVDSIRAAGFQAQHFLLALSAGEPGRLALGFALEALSLALVDNPRNPEIQEIIAVGEALTRQIDCPRAEAILWGAKGVCFMIGRWRESLACAEAAERIARERCTSAAWDINMTQVVSLNCLSMLGDLNQMSSRLPAWLKAAEERRDVFASISLRTTMGGGTLLALAADDPARARQDVADAMTQWPQKEFHFQHFDALLSNTLVDLYTEDGGRAWERVTAAWPALERSMLLQMQFVRIPALGLRGSAALAAARSSERPEHLLRAAERDAAKLMVERLEWSDSLARLLSAGVAAARGDARGACGHLEAAITGFDALEMALHAAAARRRLGELTGGDDGRSLVLAADDVMARQGVRRPDRMAATFAASPRIASASRSG